MFLIRFSLNSQEEVPPNVYYAHYKNVEKSVSNGKFDPTAGLSSSGIAGTGTDKDDEDAAANKSANADEEMKDISKKDGGKNTLLTKITTKKKITNCTE